MYYNQIYILRARDTGWEKLRSVLGPGFLFPDDNIGVIKRYIYMHGWDGTYWVYPASSDLLGGKKNIGSTIEPVSLVIRQTKHNGHQRQLENGAWNFFANQIHFWHFWEQAHRIDGTRRNNKRKWWQREGRHIFWRVQVRESYLSEQAE